MTTKKIPDFDLTKRVGTALAKEPGLSVKDMSERLKVNRQFMAGVLAVLEERRDVSCRQVGTARIYFFKEGKHESN
jgi:predicted transcriptional regulator